MTGPCVKRSCQVARGPCLSLMTFTDVLACMFRCCAGEQLVVGQAQHGASSAADHKSKVAHPTLLVCIMLGARATAFPRAQESAKGAASRTRTCSAGTLANAVEAHLLPPHTHMPATATPRAWWGTGVLPLATRGSADAGFRLCDASLRWARPL